MADLTIIEKRKLERMLGMGGGYVLPPHFSNRTFAEFFDTTMRCNIYDEKYGFEGSSKASHMRAFWTVESNYQVAKLILRLIGFIEAEGFEHTAEEVAECRAIAARLQADVDVADVDVLDELGVGSDFELVAAAVRDAIERNEPASGLDRLHTFATKYLRTLCGKHGIATERETPLNSLMGKYRNQLRMLGKVESGMTDKIMKASIEVLEFFNGVRNNHSLAHDNPMLNHNEALLICRHVIATIRFLGQLEKQLGHAPDLAIEAGFAVGSVNPRDDDPF